MRSSTVDVPSWYSFVSLKYGDNLGILKKEKNLN